MDRDACRLCEACVQGCPSGALVVKGYTITANAIIERATRMRPFFEHSGGGITLTGGEVTCQPEFAEAILAGCAARGIHTAIETCGACSWSVLERLAARADLILYDLKLIDDTEHRRWTGVSNSQILSNARRLKGHALQVRVPLIPGVTDTTENLRGVFEFARDAGLHDVCLLPFNASAAAKYEWLGATYGIEGERQAKEYLESVVTMAEQVGVQASVS